MKGVMNSLRFCKYEVRATKEGYRVYFIPNDKNLQIRYATVSNEVELEHLINMINEGQQMIFFRYESVEEINEIYK